MIIKSLSSELIAWLSNETTIVFDILQCDLACNFKPLYFLKAKKASCNWVLHFMAAASEKAKKILLPLANKKKGKFCWLGVIDVITSYSSICAWIMFIFRPSSLDSLVCSKRHTTLHTWTTLRLKAGVKKDTTMHLARARHKYLLYLLEKAHIGKLGEH